MQQVRPQGKRSGECSEAGYGETGLGAQCWGRILGTWTWRPCISERRETRLGNKHCGVSLRCERGRRETPPIKARSGCQSEKSWQGGGREHPPSGISLQEGRLFSPVNPLAGWLSSSCWTRRGPGPPAPSSSTGKGAVASAHSWGSGFLLLVPTSPSLSHPSSAPWSRGMFNSPPPH